ncbi:acyl-CoA synthetase [Aestuariivita boseongensis]|uniref:acyl-CoA synthetase n=1 Tax=Aestuariivita boseongensis TaxID=1470562 RepID=UPI0006817E27|nr:acyl-CoA synthetase [Aestuariivita boseongensis]
MPALSHPFQPRAHSPDKPAFVMCASDETVTFGALEARANQGAHLLRVQGVGIGDHIAILMENRREFLELCFAADRAGVYYTTISTHLTEDEIAFILADCGAQLLIVSERCLPLAGHAVRRSGCALFRVGAGPEDVPDWMEAAARMPESPIADEAQGLDMLYSSGTTGRPKGIKWPLPQDAPGGRTMLIDLLTGLFGYDAETRYLSPAPLYHAAPLRHSMVTIKMGGTAYIMDRFDAAGALALIEKHRITHSQWVPTMFVRLLKLPEAERQGFDLSSMKMAVHAAAPCPPDIKHKMIDWWGEIIHEYYAGTENNGFTSITSAEWLAHPGSVGQAKLGTLHICDEDGNEVPVGQTGEVYFENGHQFAYHNDPEKTASCTNAQGWTTLGDIGRVDEEGYLYLTDRKSFVIISGGVNIYPQETEDVLLTHPAVMDTAVIGVPNEDFGEEVKAIVQLVPSNDPSDELAQSLIDYCRARLSPLKCPRSIDFNDALPRSATGKLYKRKLRNQYWKG